MSPRTWFALPLALAVALIAAGCPGQAPAPTPEPAREEAPAATPAEAAKEFQGVEVNVVTFTGPQIAEPLQRRAPDFGNLTGARVNVITVPFVDLYSKVFTDLSTGTNSFDAFVFAPQWMVDFIEPGWLEPLTDRIEGDEQIQWDDIAPFFRDFSATYKGEIYTIPLDGDFQMIYYRTDVLEEIGMEPPSTWEEYVSVAEAAHGIDMNDDGVEDSGSCISKKKGAQAYWMIWSFAAGYLQSQGTGQGSFFTLEDLEPLTDNDAFRTALENYTASTQFAPPDEINLDVGDTRSLFTSGRCALSVDWGDIGTLAIDPETSVIQGKWGAAVLPGTPQVLNQETMAFEDCNADLCPHATDGINHAPYAAFGGWSGAINAAADPRVKDAAYAFFSHMSAPEQANVDVTLGQTGFNPYRISQFENLDLWLEAGMSEQEAQNYLGAIRTSLESPNMVLDLRIPQNQRYQQVVLDEALAKLNAGQITIEQAMKEIYDGWQELTEEIGREQQLNAYSNSLGVTR